MVSHGAELDGFWFGYGVSSVWFKRLDLVEEGRC